MIGEVSAISSALDFVPNEAQRANLRKWLEEWFVETPKADTLTEEESQPILASLRKLASCAYFKVTPARKVECLLSDSQ